MLDLLRADITTLHVDAIVNAANKTLLGGGGVDGAIHRAAGPRLLEECRKLQGCETGKAKTTRGYDLAARFVIHTVGPVWRGGQHEEDALLASCYDACFMEAENHGIRSIAFPSISTGAYGFPVDMASRIALRRIAEWKKRDPAMDVTIAVFDDVTMAEYTKAWNDQG